MSQELVVASEHLVEPVRFKPKKLRAVLANLVMGKSLVHATKTSEKQWESLTEMLLEAGFSNDDSDQLLSGSSSLGFHEDIVLTSKLFRMHVHRTFEGSGGKAYFMKPTGNYTSGYEDIPRSIARLEEGELLVDPSVYETEVATANLEPKTTLFFMSVGRPSVTHYFDMPDPDRVAIIKPFDGDLYLPERLVDAA